MCSWPMPLAILAARPAWPSCGPFCLGSAMRGYWPSCGMNAFRPAKKRKQSRARKPRKNQPDFALEAELKRVLGADLTVIDGVKLMTMQTLYSELGADLSAFPTEQHFTSWLMLAPKREVSGGKLIKHSNLHGRNRVANALRMAAESLKESDSYLGARYRSLRGRL